MGTTTATKGHPSGWGYSGRLVGYPTIYAAVVLLLLGPSRAGLSPLLILGIAQIACWYAFFWRMAPLCGVDRRLENAEAIAQKAREALDGLYEGDAAIAGHLSTRALRCGRSMLIVVTLSWTVIAVVLAALTVWYLVDGGIGIVKPVLAGTAILWLSMGMLAETHLNRASIRWISRQMASRTVGAEHV
jgi:hypothetical protein